jgi:hypothetical protein
MSHRAELLQLGAELTALVGHPKAFEYPDAIPPATVGRPEYSPEVGQKAQEVIARVLEVAILCEPPTVNFIKEYGAISKILQLVSGEIEVEDGSLALAIIRLGMLSGIRFSAQSDLFEAFAEKYKAALLSPSI